MVVDERVNEEKIRVERENKERRRKDGREEEKKVATDRKVRKSIGLVETGRDRGRKKR